jgi:hypothetical protein
VSKSGNRVTIVEYEVREINPFGECIDVDHYETLAQAKTVVERQERFSTIGEDAVAALVIEKHTSRRPSHLYSEPDTYETELTVGCTKALRAGGWIK